MTLSGKCRDHQSPAYRVPRNRKAIWDVETIADMGRMIVALVLAGIGAGVICIAVRVMWEISNGYVTYFVARWL